MTTELNTSVLVEIGTRQAEYEDGYIDYHIVRMTYNNLTDEQVDHCVKVHQDFFTEVDGNIHPCLAPPHFHRHGKDLIMLVPICPCVSRQELEKSVQDWGSKVGVVIPIGKESLN